MIYSLSDTLFKCQHFADDPYVDPDHVPVLHLLVPHPHLQPAGLLRAVRPGQHGDQHHHQEHQDSLQPALLL